MDQSAEKDKDVTKKDDKVKEKEKKKSVENSGYYINRPKFGNNGEEILMSFHFAKCSLDKS